MSHTPEILLRVPEPDDAPAVEEAVRESLPELVPWMGWVTPAYSLSEARSWIASQAATRDEGTAFEFLVIGPDRRILGACGINQINRVHRFANLGYWVRSSMAGRGIAVEAVRQLRQWVFSNTDLERLEIVVGNGNLRSERVAEKCGAVREGRLQSRLLVHGSFQDATMFSIVRSSPPD